MADPLTHHIHACPSLARHRMGTCAQGTVSFFPRSLALIGLFVVLSLAFVTANAPQSRQVTTSISRYGISKSFSYSSAKIRNVYSSNHFVRPSPNRALEVSTPSRLRMIVSATQGEVVTLSKKAVNIRTGVEEGLKVYESGDFKNALKMFEQSLQLPPQANEKAERQAAYYDIACCHAKLGDISSAMDALEEAVELGYDEAKQILADSDLAPLRKTERFQKLLTSLSGGSASSSTNSLDLEAEVRNPFRRFRQFVWGGVVVASGLGSAVSLTQTIGALTGKETIPLEQAAQNLAINTGIAIGMLALLRLESQGNAKDKEQILQFREVLGNATARVKEMSKMKVSLRNAAPTPQKGFAANDPESAFSEIKTLRELQAGNSELGPMKVVVLAGNAKFITESLKNAKKADAKGVEVGKSKFEKQSVYVVPVVMAEPGSKTLEMPQLGGKNQLNFVAIPQDMQKWRSLLAEEFKYGYEQGNANIFRDGIVLAIDEVGRVVQRGVGLATTERWEEAFDKWWKTS